MNTTNQHAFGLSARATDANELAALFEVSELLFTYDNGSSRTFVLTDPNGVDFLAVQDGFDGNVVIVELSAADEGVHHHAREVLAKIY